jgi:proton-dependent oligopeptide transporter, POT family
VVDKPSDAITGKKPEPTIQAGSTLPPSEQVSIASDANSDRHPPAIWFFFWGEFAERSSYYGMRAILFMYMTQGLHFADTKAAPIYTIFKQACYFLPLLGGYIADRWLGRYWTIVGFSIPYVLGHVILGFPNAIYMYIALALLAGGSGVIKPNISTLMGQTYDQKRPNKERLRSAAFMWFYFAINVGALISQIAMPEIRERYILAHLTPETRATAEAMLAKGEDISDVAPQEVAQAAYRIAFLFPTILMVMSLGVFAAGKPFYALEKPEKHEMTPSEKRLQLQTLGQLFGIFGLVVLFWFGYEHNDTLWIAFTRDYVDLRVPVLNITVAPDQLQFLNALFVIILVPVFNILFGILDPKVQIFTAMRKVLAGFVLTAMAIGIMSGAGFLAQGHTQEVFEAGKLHEISTTKVSVLWPAAAYIVLTFGEVLLYGTMLELAYTAAPKSMKGFITACFLLTNTIANFLNMGWTRFYGGSLKDAVADRGSLMPGEFFGLTALVTLAAAGAFIFVGKQFERSQAASSKRLQGIEDETIAARDAGLI